MNLTPTQKSLLLLAAVLGVLAAVSVLSVLTTTLSGSDVFMVVGAVAGGTAVAGGIALTSTPANVLPHIILILAVLGLMVALALEHVFGTAEVKGTVAFIVGGGIFGAGSNVTTAKAAAVARATEAASAFLRASNVALVGEPYMSTAGTSERSGTELAATLTPPEAAP
jgi:hypothetical protein